MTKVRGCIFCGARADLLCDGELGYMGVTDTTGKEPRLCINIQQRLKCDVEICQACATRKGVIHFKMGRSGFWDSTDYCPVCLPHHKDASTGELRGVIMPDVVESCLID